MAARTLLLVAGLAAALAALPGCADSGGTAAGVSEAQRLLGASLLPPQDGSTAATDLEADELPPGSADLDAADLPPAT